MIIFKHTSWEKYFKLDAQKLCVLAIESPAMLWSYCGELIGKSNGEAGNFCILKDFSELDFGKFCNVETNVAGININTKKLQTALIKRCVELSESPEFEQQLRTISASLCAFCKDVCVGTGYSIELDEDLDTAALFKLFSLSLKESFDSLLDKLIEYINVNIEFLKTKACIFLFLTKFLSAADVAKLFEHCKYQGLSLILIEESFPDFLKDTQISYQGLIIDCDGFEIPKKLEND